MPGAKKKLKSVDKNTDNSSENMNFNLGMRQAKIRKSIENQHYGGDCGGVFNTNDLLAMEWIVVSPQIHTMFASLGAFIGDNYRINPDCLVTLNEIWRRLSIEDRTLRTFRRAIGVSQVIKKDLLPLLINSKEDRLIANLTIRILANLTMPVECLLPMEVMSKTDAGRNTIYELNLFLTSCKEAFIDPRSTRKILEHVKLIMDKGNKLSSGDCEALNDCVLLLRNILLIPEFKNSSGITSHQNQILWNIFAQSIDKLLIEMMSSEFISHWSFVLVQLIALMYKDQHVATLQKLLNLWFEVSLSESSEDNESNTSPPDRDSGDSSSSMATSDPTSDSSDNNVRSLRKMEIEYSMKDNAGISLSSANSPSSLGISVNGGDTQSNASSMSIPNHSMGGSSTKIMGSTTSCKSCSTGSSQSKKSSSGPRGKNSKQSSKHQTANSSSPAISSDFKQQKMECGSSEVSDCGYGTQMENQESISTSSNDDDTPNAKPIHQKPTNMIQKARYNGSKPLTAEEKQAFKRKKLIRRSRLNSVKALLHHVPSDEDISHLLKEFTVDFLLKGYGTLVTQLHNQLLYDTNAKTAADSSHFFWLVSYFLKFSSQMELDLEHISSVLCTDVIFYLTYEGVQLCEQFEKAKTQSGMDLSACVRRLHLVVTAIRELILTYNSYRKINSLTEQDQKYLDSLQRHMCEAENLRCLFILLLRQFNPTIQSKQYLQDVVVTNHMLLTFLENSRTPKSMTILKNHMKLFVSVDMMRQYGLLLECFQENGQFVNDCVFTMMHHVAGDLDHVTALFQPPILKTFSLIWESDFQLCDDWSDLIEFVIHKFINMRRPGLVPFQTDQNISPQLVNSSESARQEYSQTPHNQKKDVLIQNSLLMEEDNVLVKDLTFVKKHNLLPIVSKPPITQPANSVWSEEDSHNLYWYYVQNASSSDPVGGVIDLYAENGIGNKTRIDVIEKLLEQDIITRAQYQELMEKEPISAVKQNEVKKSCTTVCPEQNGGSTSASVLNSGPSKYSDGVEELKDNLIKNEKEEFICWVQKALLEACHAKLCFVNNCNGIVEPLPYYCTLRGEAIPLVAWSSEQSVMMHCQPFVLLLHKLGLVLPADAGTPFARIPPFWGPDVLLAAAIRLGPIQQEWLKFDVKVMEMSCLGTMNPPNNWSNIDCDVATPEVEEESVAKSPYDVLLQSKTGTASSNQTPLTSVHHPFSTLASPPPPCITYTPEPNLGTKWMEITKSSKSLNLTCNNSNVAPF